MANESDWSSKEATDEIRGIARSLTVDVSYKLHAIERLAERNITISDVMYVLKNGFVRKEPIPSTREGYNRYQVESRSPNSGSRELGIVVIPDKKNCSLKIITVMWVDNIETRSGTIVGEENE